MYASTYKSGKCNKMLQVTNLLMVYMYVYTFAILMDQTTPTAAVDKKIIDSAAINHDLGMNQADSDQFCLNSYYIFNQLHCDQSEPLLSNGYCVTYNEDTNIMSVFNCPYFQPNGYNITHNGWIVLPRNLSQLNDYMCGPLNRKGLVCSECADGFGPSVTSLGYRCANCTDVWYGVPLFLFLEFVPITAFYITCLVFQISVTTAPMPCFIMYAQLVVIAFDSTDSNTPLLQKIIPKEVWDRRLDLKVVLMLYRVLNLEFGNYFLPPYCLSGNLKFIHVAYLGYISAFYPPLLICLTWICVELHGRNFRPLVWLWRPFHRCFVRLRRGWDTKSDIIDVFTTSFFLSYGKIVYQTLLLISYDVITNINELGQHFTSRQCVVDQSISYGSTYHLLFAIPALFIFIIFSILPPLLLILYPIGAFRSCLSRCHLNSIALNIFIEKIHGCYRNGLDGGRDMRSFSGLYFFLRIVPYLIVSLQLLQLPKNNIVTYWYYFGTLFFVAALTIALAKPYQKAYMNYLDIFLLSNIALLCFIVLSGSTMLLPTRILLATPIIAFILIMVIRVFRYAIRHLSKCTCIKFILQKLLALRTATYIAKVEQNSTIDTPTAARRLIQPTSTVLNYGTCINN